MWTSPRQMVSVKLPGDLHRAMRLRAGGKGMSLEDAYEEAATRWLEPSKADEKPPTPIEIQQTYEVIDSGHEPTIAALRLNLNVFVNHVRLLLSGGRAKKRRAG